MTPRDRRALRIGAAVVGLSVMLFRVAPSVLGSVRRLEAEVASKADLLRRARAEMASVPALTDSVDAVQLAEVGYRGVFLTTDDEHGLGPDADLAARLSVAVARGEARLLRVERRPDSTQGDGLLRVGATARFITGIAGLAGILSTLEGDPAVFIERLRVTTDATVTEPRALTVELVAGGWYVVPAPDVSSGSATASGTGGSNR